MTPRPRHGSCASLSIPARIIAARSGCETGIGFELPESICPVAGVSRELFLTVLALPDKYKQVVLLHHYQQMTMEETADALRISRPAVSRRLKKAYELLRAEMEGGEERELG